VGRGHKGELGLLGSRAIRSTNMPLADSPHRSHQGAAHLPMEGGGAGWPRAGSRAPRGGLWPLARQRALCLAGFRF
jgi:hypothetical protein